MARVAYWIVYGAVYTGWLFHECDPRDVFQYSTRYFLFLCFMALGFLLPQALALYGRRVGPRAFRISVLSTLALLGAGYGLAAIRYYYSRSHPFDPFLQSPPPRFEGVPREKAPNTFRIMTLGGSTTRCATMAHPERYPSVLRGLLQERYPSVHIEVLNAGMDWYTTKHCLIHYVTYGQDWHPDLVVFMEAINDLYRSFAPPQFALGSYDELWSHFYGPAIRGAAPQTFEQHLFSYHGPFGSLASTWFSQLRNRAVDAPLETYRSLTPFRSNLEKLIHGTAASGARLVLMTQPSLYQDDMSAEELRELEFPQLFCVTRVDWFHREYPTARSMEQAMGAFNDAIRRAAADNAVVLVDAAAQVPRDRAHFTDDVHYTVQGAARVAEIVARAIIAEGLVDRAAAR